MHNNHGRHSNPNHFTNILFHDERKHRSEGGGTSLGNMANNMPKYKRGGRIHHRRSHHAEGEGINPITGREVPSITTEMTHHRKGGRACHAEGDMVAEPYGRGGKTHRRRSRRALGDEIVNHAEGDMVAEPHRSGGKTHRRRSHHDLGDAVTQRNTLPRRNALSPFDLNPDILRARINNSIKNRGVDPMNPIMHTLRRGGSTRYRRHDAEGGEEMMYRGGYKKKRA